MLRWAVALLLPMATGLFASPVAAQVFLASGAHPQFAIGPLFIEETDELRASPRRTIVYRGRRTISERRLNLGWVATVNGWSAEDHEVVIVLEGDRVRDVQSRVRRFRMSSNTG